MKRTPLITLAAGLLASCQSKSEPATPDLFTPDPLPSAASVSRLVANDRCEQVRDLMIDSVVHALVAPHHVYYGHGGPMPPMAVDAAPVAAAEKSARQEPAAGGVATAGPSHYTTTNVQERAVDEGDLVKTDGKYIYTLRNNELLVAKTWPVEKTELAARVAFEQMQPQQMYLHGDQVIVHGIVYDARTGQPTTRIVVIDVRDRTQPKLDRKLDLDGTNASSRMVDGDLYLVQNAGLQVPQKLYELGQQELAKIPRADQQTLRPWEIQSRLAKSLRQTLMQHLTTADIAAALPKIASNGATQSMACKDLYVPGNTAQIGLTALARISLDEQRTDLVGAMVTGGQIYASTESIYVTAPAYTWTPQGHANHLTAVHKFSLAGNDGRPSYVASGAVEGQVLNQFSMSEHAGDLRIATTDWNWAGQQGGNNLFVLRASGRSLETIGELRGFARGERIFAGRMFGDKGYLVTFRQTDPLFTLDLRNPRAPKIAGELKIPGFSTYIHPMGNDLLLAIGQDATEQGRITGFHMQVFDVSNPAKPTRRFHEKLSSWSNYSHSIAESDHKAFTYDPVTGTLALPVSGYANDGQFNGLVVYDVDPERGFTLHGRITHRDLAREVLAARCKDPWAGNDCRHLHGEIAHHAQIDRSIVLDKYLVTLGVAGLEIHPIEKLAQRAARLAWPQPGVQRADLVVLNAR